MELKHKLTLMATDDFWDKILRYRIDSHTKNNNEAVLDLLRAGLKAKRGLK